MKKKPIIFLEGKRLCLRPVDLSDLDVLQSYANDPEVRRYLTNVMPVSKLDEETWIKKVMTRGSDVIVAVVLKKGDKLLGTMALMKINHIDGTAETGSMLGAKEEWNKGYAREAKMLLLDYAFQTLNLRKVCSLAFVANKGSIKHNLNCGYKIEGIRKKHYYRDGKYYDQVLLAIFKQDWLKLRR
ncbi:MAG: GNAT family protein [Patescibacteria group bacterium]